MKATSAGRNSASKKRANSASSKSSTAAVASSTSSHLEDTGSEDSEDDGQQQEEDNFIRENNSGLNPEIPGGSEEYPNSSSMVATGTTAPYSKASMNSQVVVNVGK